MDRGYTWFALNNSTTDYVELSRHLANSIKQYNKHALTCIITDQKVDYKEFNQVVLLENDYSKEQEWKLNNEWQVFELTPNTQSNLKQTCYSWTTTIGGGTIVPEKHYFFLRL